MVAAGAALIAMPVALLLSGAALVTGIGLGILAMSLGISGTDTQGRGGLSVGAQAVYDRLLSLGLLAAAVIFGLAGDRASLALFGAIGVAILAVATTTRYSVRPVA